MKCFLFRVKIYFETPFEEGIKMVMLRDFVYNTGNNEKTMET